MTSILTELSVGPLISLSKTLQLLKGDKMHLISAHMTRTFYYEQCSLGLYAVSVFSTINHLIILFRTTKILS